MSSEIDEFGGHLFEDDLFEDMQKYVYETAVSHGWWDTSYGEVNIPEKLMLIVSEASEALEDFRNGNMGTTLTEKGKPEGFATELADIVIRVMDLAAHLEINLAAAIAEKHNFNLTREFRHGNKAC